MDIHVTQKKCRVVLTLSLLQTLIASAKLFSTRSRDLAALKPRRSCMKTEYWPRRDGQRKISEDVVTMEARYQQRNRLRGLALHATGPLRGALQDTYEWARTLPGFLPCADHLPSKTYSCRHGPTAFPSPFVYSSPTLYPMKYKTPIVPPTTFAARAATRERSTSSVKWHTKPALPFNRRISSKRCAAGASCSRLTHSAVMIAFERQVIFGLHEEPSALERGTPRTGN